MMMEGAAHAMQHVPTLLPNRTHHTLNHAHTVLMPRSLPMLPHNYNVPPPTTLTPRCHAHDVHITQSRAQCSINIAAHTALSHSRGYPEEGTVFRRKD